MSEKMQQRGDLFAKQEDGSHFITRKFPGYAVKLFLLTWACSSKSTMHHIMNVNINRILAIITITNTIILTREQSLTGVIINKNDKSDALQQLSMDLLNIRQPVI